MEITVWIGDWTNDTMNENRWIVNQLINMDNETKICTKTREEQISFLFVFLQWKPKIIRI